MSDDTPLGKFSSRVAQSKCIACGRITMQHRCPQCGQMLPRSTPVRDDDREFWRDILRRALKSPASPAPPPPSP